MADIEKIILPDDTELDIKDANALPLTAGSTKPLTDNLFLDTTNGTGRVSIGSAGGITVTATDANNEATVGFHSFLSEGTGIAQIYGSGTDGKIRLRPRGTNNTNGQLEVLGSGVVNVSGQITGGHPLKNNSNTSASKSISSSSSTYTNLSSLTSLEAGVYLFIGKCSFTPSASTSSVITLAISTTNSSSQQSYSSSIQSTNSTLKHLNVCMLVELSSSTTTMYLNVQSNGVAGTVGNYYFRAVRLS